MSTKSILSISLITVLLMGVISFDDSFAAKGEPNGQPFQELQTQIDDLNQRVDDAEPDPRVDSFFDVFFDVFTVDSFFDIFTELQTTNDLQQSQIDSFFDVFTEIDAKMEHFDTEILSMDLRGKSCNVGDVVTGINADGNLVCATDQTGSGGGSSGHLIVVQRSGPTTEFSADFPFRSSFAPCLSGEMVVGGGYRASAVTVNISSESMESTGGDISGWFVNAYSASGTGSITALAECATFAP